MLINCNDYNPDKLYHLLVQTVVPRPIGWVISDNGNDSYNLAPFSFFNAVASNPPVVMLSMGWKDEDNKKDTWVNIDQRNHFVVHVPSADSASHVVASSVSLAHGESEIKKLNLSLIKEKDWPLPRLAEAKVAFYCTKFAIHEIGPDPQALILGEIKKIWVDDSILTEYKGRWSIDYEILNPLARLGGPYYSLLGKKITIPRPQ